MATVIHTPLAPSQFWTEYDFDKNNIVLDEQLEVTFPRGRTLKLKTKPGFDPKITEEGAAAFIAGPVLTLSARTTTRRQRQEEEKEAAS